LPASSFPTLGWWLMMVFHRQRFPLRQIIRALLLNIRLGIYSMLACEFLGDGVLDSDGFDGFVERRKVISPANST
jgi:hypothetical protein